MTSAMPAPQANREAQAARLRDVCLELVREQGVRRTIGVHVLTEVAFDSFTVWFAEYNRMSSLDIWYEGLGRVLQLRLEGQATTIIAFQRGAWEDELLDREPKSAGQDRCQERSGEQNS